MKIGSAGKCQIVFFAEMHVKPFFDGGMFRVKYLYTQKSFIDKLRDPLINMGNAGMGQHGNSVSLPDQFEYVTRLNGKLSYIGRRVVSYMLFKGLAKRVNQLFFEQRRGNVRPADRGPIGNVQIPFQSVNLFPDHLNFLLFFQP